MPSAYITNGSNFPSKPDLKRMCLEAGRLESFDSDWPHDDESPCSSANMAKAGFFFNGNSDQVKCFCCLVKLSGWEPDSDEPWSKHQQLSPTCKFASFGKEENELTVEQWCDIMCDRAIHRIEYKFMKAKQLMSQDN